MLVEPKPVFTAERNTFAPFECLKETFQFPLTFSVRIEGVTMVYAIAADPLELTLYSTRGYSSLEQPNKKDKAKRIGRIRLI